MGHAPSLFISVWLKFLILLTPFFVLSVFLAMTQGQSERERRMLALRVTAAVVVTALLLYYFGRSLFALLGITIDAFRVGAGGLLFLSAVRLVRGETPIGKAPGDRDIAVVPLAIPVTIGPATTGALLIMGTEPAGVTERMVCSAALGAAGLCVGVMLCLAASIQRLLGEGGLTILSKLTGLGLAAMAAQMILTGLASALRTAA